MGGLLLAAGAIQYVVAMAVTQLGWTTPYSLRHNDMSDLGAVYCGYSPAGSEMYLCSPWHVLFNVSVATMGVLLIASAILLFRDFPRHWATTVGFITFAVAGAGSVGVGLNPEDVRLPAHVVSAALAFFGGNLALLFIGAAMGRSDRWRKYQVYTIASGLFGLTAFGLFAAKAWGPVGMGGMERLIILPLLLWAVVVGVSLIRTPVPKERPNAAPDLAPGAG